MPEIHNINNEKQVRGATEELRIGVFKMCFITQIKKVPHFILRSHKIQISKLFVCLFFKENYC